MAHKDGCRCYRCIKRRQQDERSRPLGERLGDTLTRHFDGFDWDDAIRFAEENRKRLGGTP